MSSKLPRSARRALNVIRYSPGLTRHDLATTLGVSITTVNPVVSGLIDKKLVAEIVPTKAERQGVGRPRAGLTTPGEIDSLGALIWGHGSLTSAIITFDDRVAWQKREPVEGVLTTDHLVSAAQVLIQQGQRVNGVRPPVLLVLGLPAPYEPGVGLGQPSKDEPPAPISGFATWFKADPQALLSERLGLRVIAENDANLGALGETARGAAQGAIAAISVKLSGHGIGAGLTVHGRLFSGSHGYAGEIAHMRVDDTSQVICACGSKGCLEEKIGRNMLRQLSANYGEAITYEDLLAMVERQVPGATRLLEDAGRVVGRALADICTFINPNVLVLDAGSPAASAILLDGVREQIKQSAPPFVRRDLTIVPSELGDAAPLIGAAAAARVELLKDSAR